VNRPIVFGGDENASAGETWGTVAVVGSDISPRLWHRNPA
jgi:hypothetical protein